MPYSNLESGHAFSRLHISQNCAQYTYIQIHIIHMYDNSTCTCMSACSIMYVGVAIFNINIIANFSNCVSWTGISKFSMALIVNLEVHSTQVQNCCYNMPEALKETSMYG